MGILCQSCNSLRIDLEPEKTTDSNKAQEEIVLPKEYQMKIIKQMKVVLFN